MADAVIDVHVNVDEAGRDQQTRGIENVMSLRRIDVLGDGAHSAARDRHVAPVVEVLRGVDDGATGYQEVIHRKSLPRREAS